MTKSSDAPSDIRQRTSQGNGLFDPYTPQTVNVSLSSNYDIHSTAFPKETPKQKHAKDHDDDDYPSTPFSFAGFFRYTGHFLLTATVLLYILNQKHMLPKPLGRVVSKALFWPTLPITFSTRIGKWISEVDDVVVMGGAPFAFLGYPRRLRYDYGIRGVVNLCDEYRGPMKQYKKLGMRELWLRTVDHFEPSFEDLKSAVEFIGENEAMGKRVYVHCRAGHGRSAAVALAWLLYKNPYADAKMLNEQLLRVRNVRSYLWRQPNIRKFERWVQSGGHDSEGEESSWSSFEDEGGFEIN